MGMGEKFCKAAVYLLSILKTGVFFTDSVNPLSLLVPWTIPTPFPSDTNIEIGMAAGLVSV